MSTATEIDDLRSELGHIVQRIEATKTPTVLAELHDRGRRVAIRLAEARAAEWAAQGRGGEAERWLRERKAAVSSATADVLDTVLEAEARGGPLH